MLRRLRAYFDAEAVLEVDTPSLSTAAVSDVHIESLQVSSTLSTRPLYLQPSPEFFMKRLLAAGYPDIYSIGRVFRDGESGRYHQPEFTLVEWYRLGYGLQEIIADTVQAIASALQQPRLIDEVTICNYADVFIDQCGIDPATAPLDELAAAVDADDDLRASIGSARDDWLDLILSTHVSQSFDFGKLTVLQHYPASQAALAQLCPGDTKIADRFEVFMGTTELANGYVELRDHKLQAQRIEDDQTNRRSRGFKERPVDDQFLAALESGLPECAGVAMGLERLQMTLDHADDIRDVITFAFEDSDE